jgi:hypothetical protein
MNHRRRHLRGRCLTVPFIATLAIGAGPSWGCSAPGNDGDASGNALSTSGGCDENCVIDVFKDLSKVFRPSFKEEKARDWVKNEFAKAQPAWGAQASHFTLTTDASKDELGHDISNILVRVSIA